MKKKYLMIGIAATLMCCALAAGCSSKKSQEGRLSVTYELEGGQYRNGSAVVQYYDYDESGSNYIREIGTDSKTQPVRDGYHLDGWYQTRTGEGESVTYSDKWDFSSDQLRGKSVTLYAKWLKDLKYTFELHYFDDNGDDKVQGEVTVVENTSFQDNLLLITQRAKRSGYTAVDWQNEDGTPFDTDTVHPGGEADLAIPVYVKYVEGSFQVVSTASELKRATTANIYLKADIDLGGEEFSFGSYRMKTLYGNGHKIYNFKLKTSLGKDDKFADFEDESKSAVGAALFTSAYSSTVRDVSFEYTLDVSTTYSGIANIYLAPLIVSPEKATFENVFVKATYTVTKLPASLSEENVKAATKGYYLEDTESTFENVTIDYQKAEN